ncbi:hypothetical protein R1sor_019350 [Riccia sorocarpa]|uniref:Uncharacterized protein n=1 Tax=Riccia sorocarpa TaxID=122646 RepID=A0ABD3ICD3_9MARC
MPHSGIIALNKCTPLPGALSRHGPQLRPAHQYVRAGLNLAEPSDGLVNMGGRAATMRRDRKGSFRHEREWGQGPGQKKPPVSPGEPAASYCFNEQCRVSIYKSQNRKKMEVFIAKLVILAVGLTATVAIAKCLPSP